MKTVSSFSGGKSSAYMTIHWPTDFILFACVLTEDPKMAPKDPGILRECQKRIPGFVASAEVEQTLVNVLRLEQMLGREITWVCAYESDYWLMSDTENWLPKPLTFDHLNKSINGLPGYAQRFCTTHLKVRALFWHIYLNILDAEETPCLMDIGFRVDEAHRAESTNKCERMRERFPKFCNVNAKDKKNKQKWETIEYRAFNFPMIEAGIDKFDVMKFWKNKGWKWPRYSNCAHCFFSREEELREKALLYPEHINWAVNQERKIGKQWRPKPLDVILETPPNESLFDTQQFSCFCTD